MKITALVGGVVSSDFDSNLIQQVELGFVKAPLVREKYLVVAIGNQHGEIYRLIGVDSESELAGLLKTLEGVNLFRQRSDILGPGPRYQIVLFQPGTVEAIGNRMGRAVQNRRRTL
ncbi:hypothetical protein [Herbaspirillum sp. YR522]|uniref:hypothetical protein n=1 Tax=Herbaspirillum sp. YR522 TaxID=1144342 RepID=UPI0003187C91|nr:hypothetical protein [Herbaspirillum sp. YR522]